MAANEKRAALDRQHSTTSTESEKLGFSVPIFSFSSSEICDAINVGEGYGSTINDPDTWTSPLADTQAEYTAVDVDSLKKAFNRLPRDARHRAGDRTQGGRRVTTRGRLWPATSHGLVRGPTGRLIMTKVTMNQTNLESAIKSLRDLADDCEISRDTIVRAYNADGDTLASQGYREPEDFSASVNTAVQTVRDRADTIEKYKDNIVALNESGTASMDADGVITLTLPDDAALPDDPTDFASWAQATMTRMI